MKDRDRKSRRDSRFQINTVFDDASSPITLLMNWKPPVK